MTRTRSCRSAPECRCAGRLGGACGRRALARGRRARAGAGAARARRPRGPGADGAERRRLALLATGALAAAGWLVGGVALGRSPRSSGRRWSSPWSGRGGAATRGPSAEAPPLPRGRSPTPWRRATRSAARSPSRPPGSTARPATSCATTARALALGEPTGRRARVRCAAAPPTPAWDAIMAGILLQRDAGGDLAGLLRSQAAALEAADRIGRDARAATAQARFTARLVLVLPAGAAALAELASPGLIAGLLDHPLSVWLVGMAVVLQVIAIAAVARLARIR